MFPSRRYELYVRKPESQACAESHFTVWSPNLWVATLTTVMLLIVAIRFMYKYGAFGQNSCSSTDPLQNVLKEPDHFGICVLSVVGCIGSEGKNFHFTSSVRIFCRHCPCSWWLIYGISEAVLADSHRSLTCIQHSKRVRFIITWVYY